MVRGEDVVFNFWSFEVLGVFERYGKGFDLGYRCLILLILLKFMKFMGFCYVCFYFLYRDSEDGRGF